MSGWRRSPTITRRARMRSIRTAAARPINRCRPTGSISPKPSGARGLDKSALARLSPFAAPEGTADAIEIAARAGHNFAAERSEPGKNVFEALTKHVEGLQAAGKRALIALWSEGSRERMGHVLAEHGLHNLAPVASWPQALALPRPQTALAVLGIESGFETADVAVISEEDILGERLVRPRRQIKRAENFIAEVTSLSAGDLVVHVDHGIGRFIGLRAIEAAGAPHDCLEIHYHGGDKLFLPVENIELLSRYGSEDTHVELDRLGSTAWQSRKARMKNRIREIAGELIKVAAERQLREAPRLAVGAGLYDEFCAGFPYEETDDQEAAIAAVLNDLSAGRPMDRLICGDVGFGKTEVALRAAFIAAMNGKQVAVVVPTTLLSRQHFKTFSRPAARTIRCTSRRLRASSPRRNWRSVKKGLADGQSRHRHRHPRAPRQDVKFKDLGLIVVDEEQHFGVAHKEKLKQLRAEVHVLTLTATPIPRTLQLALSGVREMSIIATPPVDRLAVRTFISPFDPVVVREALLRERYRGGQAFYVCPRIEDLAETKAFLDKNVPEVRVAVAHGQMPSTTLEDVMGAFYDGKFDVLLSTAIVESGLDIPNANTLIVHRADMFGLAQIYQLRGRVGRAKLRAYALLTLPANRRITPRPSGGSKCCNRSTRSAPASSSPPTISTSAAPALADLERRLREAPRRLAAVLGSVGWHLPSWTSASVECVNRHLPTPEGSASRPLQPASATTPSATSLSAHRAGTVTVTVTSSSTLNIRSVARTARAADVELERGGCGDLQGIERTLPGEREHDLLATPPQHALGHRGEPRRAVGATFLIARSSNVAAGLPSRSSPLPELPVLHPVAGVERRHVDANVAIAPAVARVSGSAST